MFNGFSKYKILELLFQFNYFVVRLSIKMVLSFYLAAGLCNEDEEEIGFTRSIFLAGNITSTLKVLLGGREHTTSLSTMLVSGLKFVTGVAVFIISASNLLRGG